MSAIYARARFLASTVTAWHPIPWKKSVMAMKSVCAVTWRPVIAGIPFSSFRPERKRRTEKGVWPLFCAEVPELFAGTSCVSVSKGLARANPFQPQGRGGAGPVPRTTGPYIAYPANGASPPLAPGKPGAGPGASPDGSENHGVSDRRHLEFCQ